MKLVGTKEIAELLGCSTQHVRQLVVRGVLPATRMLGDYRFDLEQVERVIKQEFKQAEQRRAS